jgi:uncharacterized membrane protein
MRKTMEVVGLAMLAVLYWITYAALHGPESLPDRIPTHFDISGHPTSWGSPAILWLLPLVGTGVYLLITVLSSIRFRRYNLPVRVTENNLPFIQDKTTEMLGWIKAEMLCLFCYIQWGIIQAARSSEFRLSPVLMPVFLGAVFLTVGWYLAAIIRGAKERAEPQDASHRMENLQ